MSVAGLTPGAINHASPDRRAVVIFLVALGLVVVTQGALARMFGRAPAASRDTWSVALALTLMLALPGALLIGATWAARNIAPGARLMLAIAAAGLLMRGPYFGAGPMLEDDHARYLLDGAMLARGLSPYAYSPEALLGGVSAVPAELVQAGRDVIAAINFPDLRSVYPGAAQALFALAHFLAPWSIDGLRAVVLACEALTALLIWRALISTGRAPLLVALFWCNPLMAFCLTGQAHLDAALAPPILAALFVARCRAGALAGLCLGVAAGVKLWPVLLAPLLARWFWPDRRALLGFAAALGTVTALFTGPLLWASLSANAGLTAYAGGWSVNNAPYAWASYLFLHLIGPGTGERLLRALIVTASLGLSLAIAAHQPRDLGDLIRRAALLAAGLFFLAPAQFPWYAAWFLPLAAACGSFTLAAASVGLPVYYLFFPLAAAGLRDIHGYGLAALHLLPVLVMALLLRRASPKGAAP